MWQLQSDLILKAHWEKEDLPSQPGHFPSSSAVCLPDFHTQPVSLPFPTARFPGGCSPAPNKKNQTHNSLRTWRRKNQHVLTPQNKGNSQSSQSMTLFQASGDGRNYESIHTQPTPATASVNAGLLINYQKAKQQVCFGWFVCF